MHPSIRYKIRIWSRRFDGFLESKSNLILPKSLTKRYMLGLGCVAFIVFAAQILKHLVFRHQSNSFSEIRLLDRQLSDSAEFSRIVEQIQHAASPGMILDRMKVSEKALDKLKSRNDSIVFSGIPNFYAFGTNENIESGSTAVNKGMLELAERMTLLQTHVSLLPNIEKSNSNIRQIPSRLTESIIEAEQRYRNDLMKLLHFYEENSEATIYRAGTIGVVVTLLVVSILVFIALYVIRPSVRQLFEAVQTRSKFLGRMGNEIRNPLNSILGMTRLIQDTRLTEQQRHYTKVLSSSSNSLRSLLNNLIDFSKISSGKVILEYCDTDLLNVVQDCIDLVSYKADRKELDLLLNIDPNTALNITTDPLLLQQILLNLLENAVKFTNHGKVTLSIWQTRDYGRSRIHFSISDTGIGINSDKLNEIFEYFQQEDPTILRKYGGSGLGLGICLELVKLTGGEIDVQSTKGKGSTFHFYLPLSRFSDENFKSIFSTSTMSGHRALVLDGNEDRREKISSYIKSYGGEAVTLEKYRSVLSESEWIKYFKENIFDVYVVNLETHAEFIEYLRAAQNHGSDKLLKKVIALLRSTFPSPKILRLNSIGVKNFCYIPVKPIEFLGAIDLVLKKTGRTKIREWGEINAPKFELSRPISALVVDDSRDNQFLMRNYLEKHSSHMVIADNGLEAVEKYKKGSFDIVFMDLFMPELDGYEATRQIRAWEADTGRVKVPIVAVSAHTGEEEVEKCRESGFTAHLSKPLDLGELQAFIGKYFGESVSTNTPDQKLEDAGNSWKAKLNEYLPTYYKQREEDLKKLRLAYSNNEWDKIVFIGHKIKGSAATYGYPELGQAGAELEKFAQENNLPEVVARIDFIQHWLKSVSP